MQGAGSVGGLIGGRLAQAGHDVTFVTGNSVIADAIARRGLVLRDGEQEVTVSARAFTTVEELPDGESFDLICLAMMAQHSTESMRSSLARSHEQTIVVTFQNGIVVEAIGAVCGQQKLIPSTLAFGMTMEAPGEYRLTTDGSIILGELDGTQTERTSALQTLFNDAIKTIVSPNIIGVLWGKLLWNASVSAICAITNRKLGDICGDPETQGLIIRAYREAVETAEGLGVKLEKVVVDYQQMYVAEQADDTAARELLGSFKTRYASVIPSTSQSLNKGKVTEIEYLNGYVAKKARELGKPAELHERLTNLVHEIERGERTIDARNLNDIINV